ncbi:hypothetical protein [Amycolatopsis vancoresmycina]|uniref:Alcohol dehydrogenase n=1 Tax=Amycolatopsis vancoresmycina DSM 44592 TaxID=1292037 RepID=R1I359_9PSEU|nr:alcohol dehydrogenase [Amycolatopsis vancoresmycina DSM 44592]
MPEVERGRILSHEAVGTITEGGSAVAGVKPGDEERSPSGLDGDRFFVGHSNGPG